MFMFLRRWKHLEIEDHIKNVVGVEYTLFYINIIYCRSDHRFKINILYDIVLWVRLVCVFRTQVNMTLTLISLVELNRCHC